MSGTREVINYLRTIPWWAWTAMVGYLALMTCVELRNRK